MTTMPGTQTLAAPSLARLIKTTGLALAVAAVLLVTLVLPAEYAIDPLGIGGHLGLTDIASARPAPVVTPAEVASMAPVQSGPVGVYPRPFQVDVVDFVLEPYQFLEYKYGLDKGATMLYAWTADGDVEQDFHGQRPADATDGPAEQSFEKAARREFAAAYTAPFAGIHGSFWENPGGETITIHLMTAGFYTSAVEIRSNRRRYPHTPRPLILPPSR